MSSIQIQSSASGAGVITLASPNTGTNYTLTLPAQTGTVVALDSSGILMVGTTTGTAQTNITSTSTKNVLNMRNYDDTGRGVALLNSSGTTAGSITWTTSAATFATSSDYRLKENIQPMTGALNIVNQLNPVTYDWVANKNKSQGFIAHELQSVVPDCVVGEKDAVDSNGQPIYQGIDTSFLIAILTSAIKEQQNIITSLTGRIEILENK